MDKKFCKMPYEALAVTSVGKISPCCAFQNSYANDLQSIEEYWRSDLRREIISDFDNGKWHPGCRGCQSIEDAGVRSKRQKYNIANTHKPFQKFNTNPKFVEVALGNQCNVACVTCGSDFSSGWRQYDKEMPELFSDRYEFLKYNFKISRDFTDELLDKMKNNPNLSIELIGGEPFFNKEGIYLLTEMSKNNMPNEVSLTSNCSLISDDIIEIIKNLNININPSIDATGRLYDYIRNYDFNIIEQNVKRLLDANIKLILMPVFSVFNIWHTPQLIRWMLRLNCKIKLNNFVQGPSYCAINNIPHELLRDTIEEIKNIDLPTNLISSDDRREFLESLINYKQEDGVDELKKTLGWIEKCNSIRGFNIEELDDDVDLYMEYLRHGI